MCLCYFTTNKGYRTLHHTSLCSSNKSSSPKIKAIELKMLCSYRVKYKLMGEQSMFKRTIRY